MKVSANRRIKNRNQRRGKGFEESADCKTIAVLTISINCDHNELSIVSYRQPSVKHQQYNDYDTVVSTPKTKYDKEEKTQTTTSSTESTPTQKTRQQWQTVTSQDTRVKITQQNKNQNTNNQNTNQNLEKTENSQENRNQQAAHRKYPNRHASKC